MAKKAAADGQVSAAVMKQVNALRRPFTAFCERFADLSASRAELAPKFIRAYGAWLKQSGGTFVAFVRILDPEVPAERQAYRAHRSYQAADYLRRLVSRRDTAGRTNRPVRSNVLALARVLASMVKITRNPDDIWRAVETELGFTARQVGRLRQIVAETQPLMTINIKPVQAKVVHIGAAAVQARRTEAVQRAG